MHDHHHDELTRRSFLKALGASVALAGLDGCTRIPGEKILPFVVQPPEMTPGVAVHYATAMELDGYATGLIVEAHEGRPTKIEGNPNHPASLGAAGIFEQASLLQLYDPDRAKAVRNGSASSDWAAFAAAMSPSAIRRRVGASGAGLAVILEPTSSPLVGSALAKLRALYPDMSVLYYSPLRGSVEALVPQYDFHSADVILSIGSDFLAGGPFHLRYAREFADRRRTPVTDMNRLYVIEPTFTVTGANADHRLGCKPSEMEPLLRALLTAVTGGQAPSSAWLAAAARDLGAHRGRSVVITDERMPAPVRAIATALNDALANTGHTTWHTRSPLLGADQPAMRLASLTDRMRSSAIDTLVCLGGNPSYNTPGAVGFSALLRRVPNSVCVALHENETARDARWFVPAAHYLETWGDTRAYDGTYSIVQPLVQPLHGGKSVFEVLSALAGDPAVDSRSALKEVAKGAGIAADDESWSAVVRRGVADGSAFPRTSAAGNPVEPVAGPTAAASPGGIEVVFAPDARVGHGAFANNGWLQELPDPVTKVTWGNGALVSPATGARLGVKTGDMVLLHHETASLRTPVIILPGQPDDVVGLHFGYGRSGGEHVAHDVGTNVYPFWPATDAYSLAGVSIERAAGHHDLAITQTHWSMEGRDHARSETLASYRSAQSAAPKKKREPLTIYDPPQRLASPMQWAMTIDLGTCIGCSACVVACQAENNIPVVGPEDVAKSREMHWLRIDRYLESDGGEPRVVTQPMLCQHCENAPCEYVCPVGATTHSDEGLNEMVYNRCVGTRFCSNNCPYKVRRFNWFDYNAHLTETEQMAKNPDVTVRERGVMEKCTFCVQRIREAEISAEVSGRALRGDEVKTACQQACPTNAIVFGSLTERDSEMMRRRDDSRIYDVLDELGTSPRVRYLARIRNPDPSLESGK